MKKLILLMAILTLGCSKDDDQQPEQCSCNGSFQVNGTDQIIEAVDVEIDCNTEQPIESFGDTTWLGCDN